MSDQAVMAHQLWASGDPRTLLVHPKDGPSPGVELLRRFRRVLTRAGLQERGLKSGVMRLEVVLEGETKVLAELRHQEI